MNHDSILLKIFFNKENKIIGGKVARIKRIFPNILSYLNKRYPDSFSLKEIILICKQNNIDIKLHTKDYYSTMNTLEIKPYEGHIQDDTNIDNYLMSVIDN